MKRARFPRAMGIATRLAYAHGKATGVAMAPLLERAGLSRRQVDDSSLRLPVADQVAFLNLVAEAVGDDLLGFHLAKTCELRAMGLFYYVLASSATVFDVCQRGARFSTMVNEGAVQKFIDGRMIGITVSYAGVSRHLDRHQVEFWLVSLMRLLRQLTGVHVIAHRVRLTHARARGARETSAYFGCAVEYGASVDEVLFVLEDEALSISQIAWLLGYHDIGAFSHAFKSWTGMSPREVAARMR